MDKTFRQRVIDALLHDEPLPADWSHILFPPEKREAELVYEGKGREEEILADTMSVPLQPVSAFGKNGTDWHNKLIFGDNLQAMKTLLQIKEQGDLRNADGTPGVRLIYIDPPFATKKEFRGSQNEQAYQDKIAGAAFLEFLRQRLVLLRELLADDGSIYVHLDWKKGHYIKVLMDEIFGASRFRNDIIWRYRTYQGQVSSYFPRKHDIILFYTKGERNTFSLLKEQDYTRNIDYQRWNDYLVNGNEIRGDHYPKTDSRFDVFIKKWLREHPGKKPTRRDVLYKLEGFTVDDVWDIKAVDPKDLDKVYPTQKPEELLERVINASSCAGDLVLDAFAGSGTTCVVAEKLKRRWIAIDCGKLSIYTIQKRLLHLKSATREGEREVTPSTFTLYNAGLYDFTTLRKLPWPDWRFFALQLFGCKDEPHEIGGLHLDGKLKGSSVLVFNHHELSGKRIDEETVRDIHLAIGKQIGKRFFIIAPRGTFDFQQDYLDFDGIRYYALRIPYSIIHELHTRSFTALEQPRDEVAINATVDAVGFDFIRPPRVGWLAASRKGKGQSGHDALLRIRTFESTTRVHGADLVGGLETFAMLMLDLHYDGEVFDLDKFYLASDLQRDSWQVSIPFESIGKQVMAVFIDIYGNESRELIPREKFGLLSAGPARAVRNRRQHAA